MAKSKLDGEIRYNAKTERFAFLSSMYMCSITVKVVEPDGDRLLEFSSAEAAFHYFKTTATPFREKILSCGIPSKARYYGSAEAQCPMRKDWTTTPKGSDHELRFQVMRAIQWAKFTQNVVLAQRLIETGDVPLKENAPWEKETYWGTIDGKGDNNHGKILMQIRQRLAKGVRPEELIPDFTKYY